MFWFFKLIVLLLSFCNKLNTRVCPRVLYDSESSLYCSFIWLNLHWPFLSEAGNFILLFCRCIYTFYCPIYCATKVYDKNQNREKTSWYFALYKIWQCRECLVSPWGYIAENTNGWIKPEKKFLTFLDNLLFYTISLHRENGYSPRPLLCIYCIYMLCLTLITIVIYLQSLIHVHKSCTNMDIKKHAYII